MSKTNIFQKATKEKIKLRLAIFAPSGGGKTMTALELAKALGKTTAVIDTERGSARRYADRYEFDTAELTEQSIDNYISFIEAAHGYDTLIIDSGSHAWQDLLQEVDKLAKAKFKGNTWSAWSEGTPKQKKFVDAILSYPGHVIMTMRSKTEWQSEKGDDGKVRPVRIGLAPEQGKGIEYEFDMLIEMNTEHYANVIKDRTGMFQDKIIHKPGAEFGAKILEWLNTGEDREAVKAEKMKGFSDRLEKAKDDEELKTILSEAKPVCEHYNDAAAWKDLKDKASIRHTELTPEEEEKVA